METELEALKRENEILRAALDKSNHALVAAHMQMRDIEQRAMGDSIARTRARREAK